jgi:hypothetical protein
VHRQLREALHRQRHQLTLIRSSVGLDPNG